MRALPDKPEQQVSLFDSRGHFLGRADFFWRSLGVVGEADGREKYVGDELWREKQREARMVRRGILIVRWDWATAMNPAQLCALIQNELNRARAMRAAGCPAEVTAHYAARVPGLTP